MPNAIVSQIQVTSGDVYDIADSYARTKLRSIGKAVTFIGDFPSTITPTLAEGDTRTSFKYPDQSDFTIDGVKYVASSGDVFTNGALELMYDGVSEKWIEFGSTSELGDLAHYDQASGTVTAAGSVSQPTFTGTAATISSSGSVTGNVTITSANNNSGNYTPAGSVSVSAADVEDGAAATAYNYTPKGTVSQPSITVTPTTTSVTPFGSAGTLPSLTTSVVNEVLTFTFSQGTLPSAGTAKTVMTGASAALASAPTFTGKHAMISASFSGTKVKLSGSIASGATASVSGSYTPAGTVSKPTFTGSPVSVTVTGSSS